MGKVVRNHASIMNIFAVTRMFVDPVGKSVFECICMYGKRKCMDGSCSHVCPEDRAKNANYSSKDSNQGFTIDWRYLWILFVVVCVIPAKMIKNMYIDIGSHHEDSNPENAELMEVGLDVNWPSAQW